MPRARDLGIRIGVLPTGPTNSVLDVPGVGVGHTTIHRDEPDPPAGRGVARTGVTAVVLAEDAYHRRIPAGGAVLNGAGECTGFLHRAGVGGARDAGLPDLDHAARPGVRRRLRDRARASTPRRRRRGDPDRGRVRRLLAQRLPPDAGHRRRRAWPPATRRSPRAARRRPPTRARSGPGRACPATTSRAGSVRRRGSPPTDTPSRVLLLTNFGVARGAGRRRRPGRAAARTAAPGRTCRDARGSCIGIVVTDAPVDGATCQRLARRVGLGLARTGTVAHNGSGEIFLGFGTGMRLDRDGRPDRADLVAGPGAQRRCSPRSSRPPRSRY